MTWTIFGFAAVILQLYVISNALSDIKRAVALAQAANAESHKKLLNHFEVDAMLRNARLGDVDD